MNFSRRQFFTKSAQLGAVYTVANVATSSDMTKAAESVASSTSFAECSFTSTFSLDGRQAKFFTNGVKDPLRLLQISDAHMFLDDERGKDYLDNSGRMSKAYNVVKHFKTGEPTSPMKSFKEIAEQIKSEKYDAVVLTGDILSFPSAAGVDYIKECLDPLGTPYYYVAGNHDWHFEGLPGSERDLRNEWIEKRLKALYPKNVNPLCYSENVKGVKLIMIDDSIYEILPEQLDFLRKELAQRMPTLIFMHIPLFAPGRGVGFGCGHPNWNASSDGNYKIERRPQWPNSGHTQTTFDFRTEILNASNVLGVFTGHIHIQSLDVCEGKPLHVAPSSSDGSAVAITILPYDV